MDAGEPETDTELSERLFEAAPIIIASIAPDGTIERVNACFERVTGRRAEDVRGRDWFEVALPPAEREAARERFEAVRSGDPTRDRPGAILAIGGGAHPVEWTEEWVGALESGRILVMGRPVSGPSEGRPSETELRRREAQLAESQRIAQVGSWELDLRAGELSWSDETFRIFEIDRERFAASYEAFLDLIHPDDRAAVDDAFEGSLRSGEPYEIVHRLRMPDGRVKWVQERARTDYDENGEPLRSVGTVQDITALRRAEADREQAERRLRLALEGSGQATWDLDLAAREVCYGAQHAQMLGYDPGELRCETVDACYERVHPDDRDAAAGAFHAYLRGETPEYEVECRLRTRSGAYRWLLVSGRVEARDEAGAPLRFVGIQKDVHARKIAELRVSEALEEKEILLREIHHRVKNNLQTVSSLLHFQSKRATSPDALASFADVRRRLFAMSLVHDKLYRSTDLSRVDLSDYFRSLVAAVAASFESRGVVRVEDPAAPIHLPIASALPAGMLLTELLTNVYKYAWPAGRAGVATVRVAPAGEDVVLRVTDDGVGFPQRFDPETTPSFGWQLIRMLAGQLGGSFRARGDDGVDVEVRFPRCPGAGAATPLEPAGGAP